MLGDCCQQLNVIQTRDFTHILTRSLQIPLPPPNILLSNFTSVPTPHPSERKSIPSPLVPAKKLFPSPLARFNGQNTDSAEMQKYVNIAHKKLTDNDMKLISVSKIIANNLQQLDTKSSPLNNNNAAIFPKESHNSFSCRILIVPNLCNGL